MKVADNLAYMSKDKPIEDSVYNGEPVKTNTPYDMESNEPTYCVYVTADDGATVKVVFKERAPEPLVEGVEENQYTPTYWQRLMVASSFMDGELQLFTEQAFFDAVEKTIISVKDGVQRYLGAEIGRYPHDKEFTIYRSPATVAAISPHMAGVPIIQEHIPVDKDPSPEQITGTVKSCEVREMYDEASASTLALANKVAASDAMLAYKESGGAYFSLGYKAALVPHSKYDYEQTNVVVRHLAQVEAPRGGDTLTFTDGVQQMALLKEFCDADGVMNIQRIGEMVQGLPEAIKMMDIKDLSKMMPMMEKMMETAKASTGAPEDTPAPGATEQGMAGGEGAAETETMDQEAGGGEDMEGKEDKFTDAQVVDRVKEAIKEHTGIVDKARPLLADDYNFSDKDSLTIMRDTLKRHDSASFTDSEVPIAFKLLKVAPKSDFADSRDHSQDSDVWGKEL